MGAMASNAKSVREFHEAVGSADPSVPTEPSEATLVLRRTLIEEEYREVQEAFRKLQRAPSGKATENSFNALVHELTDMLYVTYGALLAFGVEPDEVFAEVHRANMQKVSGPRRQDGKQLKPTGWRPADVPAVLVRQRQRGWKPPRAE